MFLFGGKCKQKVIAVAISRLDVLRVWGPITKVQLIIILYLAVIVNFRCPQSYCQLSIITFQLVLFL